MAKRIGISIDTDLTEDGKPCYSVTSEYSDRAKLEILLPKTKALVNALVKATKQYKGEYLVEVTDHTGLFPSLEG